MTTAPFMQETAESAQHSASGKSVSESSRSSKDNDMTETSDTGPCFLNSRVSTTHNDYRNR